MQQVLALAVFLFLPQLALADTVYVDEGLNSGLDDGTSWANAYRSPNSLKAAIVLASPGDQVFVRQGTYVPSISGDRWMSFEFREGVEVYGGFAGGESSPAERPPFGSAPTILSGDLQGNDGQGLFADNSYNVLFAQGVSQAALIDGFVITGGVADGPTAPSGEFNNGGGLHCAPGGSPTVSHCLFIGNQAASGGGGCYVNDASPRIVDCTFDDNESLEGGGAYLQLSGPFTIDRCVFRMNQANIGGGVSLHSSFVLAVIEISNCIFEGNLGTSGWRGVGALFLDAGLGTRVNCCTFVGNNSTGIDAGGVLSKGQIAVIRNCILWDNRGQDDSHSTLNQISGVIDTRYSLVEGGHAAAGNLAGPPSFVSVATGDYRLAWGSAGIDAGDSNEVPAGTTLDLAGLARFVDDGTTANSGVGVGNGPIVDMGAHEAPDLLDLSAYCFGDGSGLACPCNNLGSTGAGCANGSNATGAWLSTTGTPSLSTDSFVLHVLAGATQQPGLFFLGDQATAAGNGVVFGDGLRCAGGSVVRLEVATADVFGDSQSSISISQKAGLSQGAVSFIQYWYRDPLASVCGSGFNLSNGVEVHWIP